MTTREMLRDSANAFEAVALLPIMLPGQREAYEKRAAAPRVLADRLDVEHAPHVNCTDSNCVVVGVLARLDADAPLQKEPR